MPAATVTALLGVHMGRHSSRFLRYGVAALAIAVALAFTIPPAYAGKPTSGGGGGGKGGGKGGGGGGGGTTETSLSGTLSGEAYGAWVDVQVAILKNLLSLKLGSITIPRTPDVVLPPGGGMDAKTVLSISLAGVLDSQTLDVLTVGAIGPHKAGSHSQSTIEGLDVLDGLITADAVVAMCSSWGTGTTAVSDTSGSTLANLQVAGLVIDAVPEPNTVIHVAGVADIILNEQLGGGDGKLTTATTVNMIHVKLVDKGLLGALVGELLGGEIIVSSAHCDLDISQVNEPPTMGELDGFMTGGGRLGDQPEFATFGFNAGVRGGTLGGQLEFNDHSATAFSGGKLRLHSTSVDDFQIVPTAECLSGLATFSGQGEVNGSASVSYEAEACDNGEPGRNRDTFRLTIPDLGYDSGWRYDTVMSGGNLQLHVR